MHVRASLPFLVLSFFFFFFPSSCVPSSSSWYHLPPLARLVALIPQFSIWSGNGTRVHHPPSFARAISGFCANWLLALYFLSFSKLGNLPEIQLSQFFLIVFLAFFPPFVTPPSVASTRAQSLPVGCTAIQPALTLVY